MLRISDWEKIVYSGKLDDFFRKLLVIPNNESIPTETYQRFDKVIDRYISIYEKANSSETKKRNTKLALFSAPGRTEMIGNHTDHQKGQVLAGAVNMDVWGCAAPNQDEIIRFVSEGWPSIEIDVGNWTPVIGEKNTTKALLRGVAAGFVNLGHKPFGLNIYCQSNVLPGSGLSSSAAIEIFFAIVFNYFWANCSESAQTWAKLGQKAENNYFGKPSGLMDQMASAVGSAVFINFSNSNNPVITPICLDLNREGYALCIINSGADHSNLTNEYASITNEMLAVADNLGVKVLNQTDKNSFIKNISQIRPIVGDRAILRALHFYNENERVRIATDALINYNFDEFLKNVNQSGESSWCYLQNISPAGSKEHQEMALAIAIAKDILKNEGAVRVHGGGFAGTVQAFVPLKKVKKFHMEMESIFGENSCNVVQIRSIGGCFFPELK